MFQLTRTILNSQLRFQSATLSLLSPKVFKSPENSSFTCSVIPRNISTSQIRSSNNTDEREKDVTSKELKYPLLVGRELKKLLPKFGGNLPSKNKEELKKKKIKIQSVRYCLRSLKDTPTPFIFMGVSAVAPFVSAPLYIYQTDEFLQIVAESQLMYGAVIFALLFELTPVRVSSV